MPVGAIKSFVKRHRSRCRGVKISLDYPVRSAPRYGYGKPPHAMLYQEIKAGWDSYESTLRGFLALKEDLLRIPAAPGSTPQEPCWSNPWLPPLDAIALYSFLSLKKPRDYFEIGSGNSTKFARRAIVDHNLPTTITSLDPHPRAEVGAICDEVIRQRLEEIDLAVFDGIEPGDILFIDGTHRCFMNSDVTVVFLEILPRLPAGVLVEFHDIMLPYDYRPEWADSYYSEQYLLAAYILAGGDRFEIVLPNAFISEHSELRQILAPLWNSPGMQGLKKEGGSFWIQTK